MILTEVFDQVYPFKFKKYDDGKAATFKNANGDKVTVSFIGYHIPENGWSYEVSFAIKDSTELTGKGDEFKTFSTVIAIVDTFLKEMKFKPTMLFCTGDSVQRSTLYKKLARRIADTHKYTIVKIDDLIPNVQKWAKHLDFEGENAIMMAKDFVIKGTS